MTTTLARMAILPGNGAAQAAKARLPSEAAAVAFNVARGLAVLVLCWQAAVWLLEPPHYLLPAPGEVLDVFLTQYEHLLRHTSITVLEIALGLFFGTLAGILTAVGAAALPATGRVLWPLVLVAQGLPVFAIAPLLVLWFGFGLASKVVMTSLIIFFPVASAFADGIRRTERDVLDAAALAGASHWQTLWQIRLPLGLPGLASGLRVAAPLAPLGAVIGEWVGASGGLGFIILQSNARMQTAEVFAVLAILAVLTLALRAVVDAATAHIAPWAEETPP